MPIVFIAATTRFSSPTTADASQCRCILLAALSNLPGLGFDFFSLKALSALESLLTLPALLWMGMELLGDKRKHFKLVAALLLTGLVAVSYWHVIIGRQGLRIPFTPLVTALLLIYLARAMRHNRRSDFVKVGLILGFGLYMYQAVRMLPVVVVVGVLMAMAVRRISWRERLRYLLHLAILVFVSLMVFCPCCTIQLNSPTNSGCGRRRAYSGMKWPSLRRSKPSKRCERTFPYS